ncbi:bifunctional phosphopantothenoylcysteine decarboxylase/phosphopantothenate--cysteine ligase CoaBC [Anaerosphaera multitolerans]|uniref:Coenzyme A biosynthesis bifunctional protein CoaBC n=1 Tax=Anaerosphaera multitolerans TaxID=2487351 RepID=A0A437S6X2_9FIRM|nr:bifunctional phosphopantothenoylcysteine decarboxylase/phosphopantothenate--cysteine ligase CoaBC [Anaerosphaera multitolerans]RVU54766.1 bifunctional phosphopantothenoylcysteine decarboxylase/phosphopantothenate--cysteine ligase CoaBC [Anaerosphaera multitolerans]
MLKDKNILLGVTGGIAAYKSPSIVSLLKKQGANVKVVMTDAACEFVTPLTFQTMSNKPVHVEMFNQLMNMDVEHISLAKWADVIVVAPCTANTIGKFANGICDNLLTTVLMASRSKIIIAPAMNTFMLNNKFNQENIKKLEELGVVVLDTQKDLLACNDVGAGKMLEPEEIVQAIDYELTEKDLRGKKFIITSGPTIEELDPVRYLTNHSSGKMGYALAREAKKRGATVTLISGPTSIEPPKVDEFVRIKSTQDMFNAVESRFNSVDVLIKAAAPADFKPKIYSEEKIKKTKSEDFNSIELEQNIDIAKHFGKIKGNKIVVGFAAESNDEINYGKGKLKAKNFDLIVVNNITKEGAGFKSDTNIASIIDKDENVESLNSMSKNDLANEILNRIRRLLQAR